MIKTLGYEELKHGAAAVRLPRDVIAVEGPDAQSYLQGQVSQDIDSLAIDESAYSLILQPQGKVDAWFRISRLGDAHFVLDVDAGAGDALIARINRFMLRVDFTIEVLDWDCVAVRGPQAPHDLDAAIVTPVDWAPMHGVDLLGPSVALPSGVAEASLAAYEVLRIEAGIPIMDREFTEDTIPAESGIVERSASFTKGCYTGQELVARIESRGNNTPRNLRGLVCNGDVSPPIGAALFAAGNREKSVGTVTSVAISPERQAAIALAYVGRGIEVSSLVDVVWDGGETVATVNSLPLV